MAQFAPITVLQHNDRTLEFDLASADLTFSLTGKTIEFFIKRYKSDPDEDAVVKLTSANAAEVEITDVDELKMKVKLRATHLAVAGMKFYRLDIVEGTFRATAMYGPFKVEDV